MRKTALLLAVALLTVPLAAQHKSKFDDSDFLKSNRRRTFSAAEQIVITEHERIGGSEAMRGPNRAVVKQFLTNTAIALNRAGIPGGPYGILLKPTGENCDGISCDIICTGNGSAQKQWDVLVAVGEASTPGWAGPLPTIAIRECVVPSGDPVVPNPPQPQPQPDVEQLKAQLARLQQDFNALRSIVLGNQETIEVDLKNLRAETKDIRAIIDALPKSGGVVPCESLPPYHGRAWFGSITSRPVCK